MQLVHDNDAGSTGSTVTVARHHKTASKADAKKAPKKRQLRFNVVESKVIGHTFNLQDLRSSELKAYWWTKTEQKRFRENAKSAIARSRSDPVVKDMLSLINDSYRLATVLSLRGDPDEVSSALEKPSHYTYCLLDDWTALHETHDCRGMERYASKFHRTNCSPETKRWRQNVVKMHAAGEPPEKIAEEYGDSNLASKVFSRMLGHADWVAAYDVPPPEETSCLVDI